MPTDQEPTLTVKLLQLVLLSTYWGMQIWVTFVSSVYNQKPHCDIFLSQKYFTLWVQSKPPPERTDPAQTDTR